MSQTEPERGGTPHVSDLVLERAEVGDILLVSADREIPDGYLELKGQQLPSHAYPEFVSAMGIAGLRFTLPKPERVPPEVKYVIRIRSAR
jgi:hypothetical protein